MAVNRIHLRCCLRCIVFSCFIRQVWEFMEQVHDLPDPSSWLGWRGTFPVYWEVTVDEPSLPLTGNSRHDLHLLPGSLRTVCASPHMFKTLIKHALDSTEYISSLDQVGGGTSIILGLGTILWWGRMTYLRSMCWAWLTLSILLSVDLVRHERKGRGGG